MEQCRSWEANSHSDSQEIPRLFVQIKDLLPCSQDPANRDKITLTSSIFSRRYITSGASVASTSEVHTSGMLLLQSEEK
jgi:hypothetical protein